MLIFYPDTYPFKLVIEVLVALVQPGPDLLLDIARDRIRSAMRVMESDHE